MDKNYLKNLSGSPYVDESLWDRIKSRGAAGVQRVKGATATGWAPPEEKKLESLFNSFKNKVNPIVRDFLSTVIPNIQKNRPSDLNTYQNKINQVRSLDKILNPPERQGYTSSQLGSILKTRKYNDPSVIQGVDGTRNESVIGEASAFNIPISLLNARQSNDTTRTIAAYLAYIKSLYNNFIRDVQISMKKKDETEARNYIAQNGSSFLSILNKIEDVINLPKTGSHLSPPTIPSSAQSATQPTAAAPATTPAPATSQPQPTATNPAIPSATPPVLGTTPPVLGTTPPVLGTTPPVLGTTPPVLGTTPPVLGANNNNDILTFGVLKKVIHLLIHVIGNDPRAKQQPHNFMDMNKPPIKKWEYDKTAPTATPGLPNLDTLPPITEAANKQPRSFLEKFRASHRKNTGFYTVPVGTFEENGRFYSVFWNSYGINARGHGTQNDIIVHVQDQTGASLGEIVLFSFFDHEISPYTSMGKAFSIPALFKNAHPKIKNPFTNAELQELNDPRLEDTFQRVLYAVTHRKAMEYKTSLPKNASTAIENIIPTTAEYGEDELLDFAMRVMNFLPDAKIATVQQYETKIRHEMDLTNAVKVAMDTLEKAGYTPDEISFYIEDTMDQLAGINHANVVNEKQLHDKVKEKIDADRKKASTPAPTPPAATAPTTTTTNTATTQPPATTNTTTTTTPAPPSAPPTPPAPAAAPAKPKSTKPKAKVGNQPSAPSSTGGVDLTIPNANLKKLNISPQFTNAGANRRAHFEKYIKIHNQLINDPADKIDLNDPNANFTDNAKLTLYTIDNTIKKTNLTPEQQARWDLLNKNSTTTEIISTRLINPYVSSNFIN